MLAILLGEAQGAERERAERLAEAMPDARVVTAVPADADAVLLAGDGDPTAPAPGGARPVLAWISAAALAGRRPWPRADAILVPSSQAGAAALRHGYRRPAIHVVGHPVRGDLRPAIRPAVRDGTIALACAAERWEPLRAWLARLPAVREVRPLTAADGGAAGIPDAADELALAVLAMASTTGALPVALMERGIPIVALRAGAAADLIVDGLCGWLVEPTPAALMTRVQAALADRWARESAGVAARDRVLARCSPAALAAGVEAALAGVSKCNLRVDQAGAAGAR